MWAGCVDYLYRDGEQFALVRKELEIRVGKAWVPYDLYRDQFGEVPGPLPAGRSRDRCEMRRMNRAEAEAWLARVMIDKLVPDHVWDDAPLAADVKQRLAIRETGNFTPLVVGMALRTWKVETLAEFVCPTLFRHSPWLAKKIARLPRAKEDAWRLLEVAKAGEALALCAVVWHAMGLQQNPWRNAKGDEGIEIRSVEGDYSGRPEVRDLAGLPDCLHPTAHDVMGALAHGLHWCWHDLASEALRDLPPSEAVELLDVLCVLDSWASEVEGLESDHDRPGPTRLQLAAAAARRAHYFPKAA